MTGIIRRLIITILFLIMIIPVVFLSFFALRGIDQEEANIRKNFENTLLLELNQTNTRIDYILEEIKESLHNSLPADVAENPEKLLNIWKKEQSLVGMTFYLNEERSIRFPDINRTDYTKAYLDEVNLFYWRYLNFFSNNESIPIYKNIAEAYEEEILKDSSIRTEAAKKEAVPDEQKMESANLSAAEAWDINEEDAVVDSTDDVEETASEEFQDLGKSDAYTDGDYESSRSSIPSPSLSSNSESGSRSKSAPSLFRSKAAIGIFESDEEVQEQIYQKAQEEGQKALTRNVSPQLSNLSETKEKPQTVVRSVYIESTRNFEELIKNESFGIIPRIFDNSFILLFWEKQGDTISGCELQMNEVHNRLISSLQSPANQIRYINILDNGGRPLVPVENITNGDWRQPLIAKEINELLPYWETAILLSNPAEFEARIESSRLFLFVLIIILAILIFTGMTAIFQYSAVRLKAVQQKVGFVTGVSHELKTPLTSIRMYSEMLAEGRQKDEAKQKKYLEYIVSESQRLTRLISNVLDFAKLEKGTKKLNKEYIDLNNLISTYYEGIFDEYTNRGIKLVLSLDKKPLPVFIDVEAVTQVLINLLTNAEKYSPDKKEITLATYSDKKNIFLSVSDRGCGIHPKYRKKIFKDFYRIDTRLTADTRGTGLGLAIAKRILKAHGGNLIFRQREKDDYTKGSTFIMSFPALPKKVHKNEESGGQK